MEITKYKSVDHQNEFVRNTNLFQRKADFLTVPKWQNWIVSQYLVQVLAAVLPD